LAIRRLRLALRRLTLLFSYDFPAVRWLFPSGTACSGQNLWPTENEYRPEQRFLTRSIKFIMEDTLHQNKNIPGILVITAALLAVLAMIAPLAFCAEQQFTTITTDQLKAMVDEQKTMMLIDARSKDEYQEAHIEGAISIPEKTFNENMSLLPQDKNALLVLYCNGTKCGKSKKAALKAAGNGYTHILVYGDGFPVWEEKGYKIVPGPDYAKRVETAKVTPVELQKLIEAKTGDFILVDVRDESEYKEGHIPSAINIPAETFASRSDILPKEKKIIVYCNTGGRSYAAYRKMMKLAYPSIAQTLFADWKEAGMDVVGANKPILPTARIERSIGGE
jgi:rhodanese-related sulfurtransferase